MPDRVTFTAPDGTVLDFTDEAGGLQLLAAGTRGLRSPSYRVVGSQQAGIDGERLDALTAGPGDIALGLLVEAADEDQLSTRIRRLVHATRPKTGDGVLRWQRPDGTIRQLTCRIVDGLPGSEDEDATLPGVWWRTLLKVWAGDPWWYGDPVTVGFGLAAPSVFLSPTLPMPRSLSASSVQGVRTVDLTDVDDPSPGVWTITGPGAGLVLTRELLLPDGTVDPAPMATAALTSSVMIPDGGQITIRTKRGEQSIRRDDGSNLGGTLAAGSAFWPLVDGRINRVSVQLGAAGANSLVDMVYRPKFGGI